MASELENIRSRRGEPKRFSQTTNQKPSRGSGRDAAILETAGRERVFVRGDASGARHNEACRERVLDVGARDVRITHRAGEARLQSGARFARDGLPRFRRRRRGGGPKARRGRGGPRNRARGDGRHRRRRRRRSGKRGVARAGVPSRSERKRTFVRHGDSASPAGDRRRRRARLRRRRAERAVVPGPAQSLQREGSAPRAAERATLGGARREDVRAPESRRGVQYYLP